MLPAVNQIWLWYGISSILLTFPGSISANQLSPLIPPGFDKICQVQHSTETSDPIRINCELSSHDNQTWSLNSLRDWIASPGNNQSNLFSYNLMCDLSGGSVSVPWPMKCPQLVELTVRNCNITDIFSDYNKDIITTIPPQLTKLEISDSAMVIKYSNLLRMFSQIENITSDYDCLHDKTVERITFRNVSYDLENDVMEDMIRCAAKLLGNETGEAGALALPPTLGNHVGEADSSGTTEMPKLSNDIQGTEQSSNDEICDMLDIKNIVNLPQRLRDLQVSCHYEKLRYLDDSVSSTLSVYHHRFLTKYSHFPILEFLNYSYNNIDVIPPELSDWSFYFKVLKYMDLSHNRIHTLKFKSAFTGDHVNDTYINVQYNNITTLTPKDLDLLKKLRKTFIDVKNNPIHCNCELRDFIDAISNPDTFTGSLRKYDYIRNMVCHFPLSLKGRQLKSLTVDDLGCESATWIVPFVVLAVIAVILFTLVLLAFIYRREIRILFYTRLNIHIPGTVYVGLGPKSYHAFVSYSNEDEDWVLDVLCKQLEDPTSVQSQDTSVKSHKRKSKKLKQFKLCLHARDFVPGMTIIENIINSVEKSRHTIIVLTANFVQSKWAMEEFFQAYQQSVLERRRHLIIVIRGDLPEDAMDPVLKRCLKTFTYLKASDKIFYDRLAYSLSTEDRMTKEESSKEEEILKSRKKTVSVDMPQENDSGIFITSDEFLTGISGQFHTQTSVISIANSDMGLIEATHL